MRERGEGGKEGKGERKKRGERCVMPLKTPSHQLTAAAASDSVISSRNFGPSLGAAGSSSADPIIISVEFYKVKKIKRIVSRNFEYLLNF